MIMSKSPLYTDEEFAEFTKHSNDVDEIPIERVKWFLPQEEFPNETL
jgi:hypothetical protein